MEEHEIDNCAPDNSGILDLTNQNWVTLDNIVWTYGQTLLILKISCNQIQQISNDLGNLLALREFIADQNLITKIPSSIGKCTELRVLNVQDNRLQALPKEIKYCTQLQVLNVAHNLLEELPVELGKLNALKQLDISYNKLTSLPDTLCDCQVLESIQCNGNKGLTNIPELIRGNTTMIIWMLSTMKRHRMQITELMGINQDLERLAHMGDEERLKLRQEITKLHQEIKALQQERPYKYLYLKKQAYHVTSQVCTIM